MSERKVYRKRTKRREDPPNVALQSRDLEIFQALYQFRLMSQGQLERLFWNSKTPAQRRLEKLYDTGYLERRLLLTQSGRNPTLYVLGKKAIVELQRHLGLEKVKWYDSYTRLANDKMAHELAVVELYIQIKKACEQLGLEYEFVTDVEFRREGGADRVVIEGKQQKVIPDLFAAIKLGEHPSLFFIEVDRGEEKLATVRNKYLAYLKYLRNETFIERFRPYLAPEVVEAQGRDNKRNPSMRVLTVVQVDGLTPNAGLRRLKSLIKEVEHDQLKDYQPRQRFWFARFEDLTTENILTEPVWTVRMPQEQQAGQMAYGLLALLPKRNDELQTKGHQ